MRSDGRASVCSAKSHLLRDHPSSHYHSASRPTLPASVSAYEPSSIIKQLMGFRYPE